MKRIPHGSSCLARAHKWTLLAASLFIALTGFVWMAAHYAMLFFPDIDGIPLRSAMHSILIGHGVLAYGGAILLGSLIGRHIPAGLRRPRKAMSGIVSLVLVSLLIVTALFLYYAPTRELHQMASQAHQAVGVICVAAIVRHITVWGRRKR